MSTRHLQIDIPNQSTPSIDTGTTQQLPLWDHFMSSINQDVDSNEYGTVNEDVLDGDPVAAGVEDPSLPCMLQELQTSFTPSDEISPGSQHLTAPAPFLQPELMPNGGFKGHYDMIGRHAHFTYEDTRPSSARQAAFSLVGLPNSALPRTVNSTLRHGQFAETGQAFEANGTLRREIAASRLPPLITQLASPYWSNPCEPLSTDWQVRRDSVIKIAPLLSTMGPTSSASTPPGFESNDSRNRGSEAAEFELTEFSLTVTDTEPHGTYFHGHIVLPSPTPSRRMHKFSD
ncbi:hypothetical protein M409DRAFT_27726 [Zasmidium cellare ATCC 36951]|uniref:Uncharacterized protein n=1 Tax=Zasmidium cellare ATCC 36951 TaxID=1080233 RepID=A0A6A6C4P3_ZASCE|nr:uncharacterized protein M409DRAFT_27726 [Zasmidium cellare ATCC 36951]KAF2162001.1 hypothetical protein M409DRAFT_27726 [Zasmidium cellare ATCC 36951]